MAATKDVTVAKRVQRHRLDLRRRGLRPIQIWVADTRAPGFAEEAARQARLVRDTASPEDKRLDEAWFETSAKSDWIA